jgi:threonine synthase
VYDSTSSARHYTRESIATGPPSLWRYGALLPVETPAEQRLAPGFTPLVAAPRLAEALGVRALQLKLDTANPTHSFKDRVVRGRLREGPRARPADAGLLVDREPRGRRRGACRGRRARGGRFCPQGWSRRSCWRPPRTARRSTRCSGATTTAAGSRSSSPSSCRGRFVNVGLRAYYAEGSKTLAFEIAEQRGWAAPDVVVSPVASGALFSKLGRGFGELLAARPGRRHAAAARRRQAEGCAPVAARSTRASASSDPAAVVRELARVGNPADGDHAVAAARGLRRAVNAVPENEIGSNMALLAESSGVFGKGPRRALRRRAAPGGRWPAPSAREDRSSSSYTGDGLKTPRHVADRASRDRADAEACSNSSESRYDFTS